MIQIQNITKNIGARTLFENINFSIQEEAKVALVGPNGSGKSTLMRIMAGLEEADKGTIRIHGENVAYVPQELVVHLSKNVREFLGSHEYAVKEVLKQVGLLKISLDKKLSEFSGGEKTRLMIAQTLLQKPTFLLLDEPTNHLDKDGVLWFRNFVEDFKGTIFLISHDRQVLEVMTQILEINPAESKIESYEGGWKEYETERALRREKKEADYELQQKEKKRLEEWLHWKQVQARANSNPTLGKQLRAMEKRLEREIYSQELTKPKDQKKMKVNITGFVPNAKLLISLKNISFVRNEKTILYQISFEIRGQERVILSGPNGSGKSTLMRIMAGELAQNEGDIKIGQNVKIGYFAQEHESLDPDETVLESFENSLPSRFSGNDSRAILGAFLFGGDSVFKKIQNLSPGERVRLIFAKLTNQENDLLLLDEPTNHLDLQSKEVIENALKEYQGGILAVSHDPYFIKAIFANRELFLQHGNITERVI